MILRQRGLNAWRVGFSDNSRDSLFKLTAEGAAAEQGAVMQANALLPFFGLRPDYFAVYENVHVVFPLVVTASAAQFHSAKSGLAGKFFRSGHVLG